LYSRRRVRVVATGQVGGSAVRVVVAPDKFKGSLSAPEVAAAVAAGLTRAAPGASVAEVPVADGGDGTLDAAVGAGFERVPLRATGPTGDGVDAAYARRQHQAVVELAAVSGLQRLPDGRLDPLGATSAGTGEVIRAALDDGCRVIILGIGGSAGTDGGAGLVTALGGRVLDEAGRDVPPGGAALARARRLDLSGLHPGLAQAQVVVASDVDNPLLGPQGAAAVYGPQKGASPDDVVALDAALRQWAKVVQAATGTDLAGAAGAGAAGGVGFAALSVLGATIRPGIELVLELVGFDAVLTGTDLVVTGEGALDEQSLRGKVPVGVAAAARRAGVPVVAVCGRRLLDDAALRAVGIERAYALTDIEPDPSRCVAEAGPLLGQLAGRIATDWLGEPE